MSVNYPETGADTIFLGWPSFVGYHTISHFLIKGAWECPKTLKGGTLSTYLGCGWEFCSWKPQNTFDWARGGGGTISLSHPLFVNESLRFTFTFPFEPYQQSKNKKDNLKKR